MTKPGTLARLAARSWFRTQRPPHAFVVAGRRLVYVLRSSAASAEDPPFRSFERALGEDALSGGRGGIPIAGPSFTAAVGTLLRQAGGKVTAASLVVPDEWVRVVTVDVEKPDQSPKEVDEILLWKLGKLFGEPAPPLRVAWQTAGPSAEGTRVLGLGAPEEAAASWEAAFQAHGVRIGSVETASLAVAQLCPRLLGGDGFLVWAGEETASTVFFRGGELRFLRTKLTSDPDDALQEIRLAASFVDADAPAGGDQKPSVVLEGACAAGPEGSVVVERLRAFRAENGARDVIPVTAQAVGQEAKAADPAVLVGLGAISGEG